MTGSESQGLIVLVAGTEGSRTLRDGLSSRRRCEICRLLTVVTVSSRTDIGNIIEAAHLNGGILLPAEQR